LGEETIKKVLRNSGLTEKEAEVYIFLSQHDVRKGAEIAQHLRKDKAQIFRILKKLQAKGFVEATLEFPSRFTVVPFENVLNSLVKTKQEEVAFIKSAKKELLDYLKEKRQVEPLEKFLVIKGNKKIYSKISQIIRDTKAQLSIATTFHALMLSDRLGIFDIAFNHKSRSQMQCRFLSELSKANLRAAKALASKASKAGFNFHARNPHFGLSQFPRMVIRDDEEVLFFMSRTDTAEKGDKEEACLWTNCKSLVHAFGTIFEDLWHNSTEMQRKINEIEIENSMPNTCIMTDKEVAAKKYFETLQAAKKEIVLLTTSKGLIEYAKNKGLLRDWAKSGASIKIMAPITRGNSEAAQQLQKTFAVRHVPENYMVATIVDEKHFFQFKTRPWEQGRLDSTPDFDNLFYITDLEYVRKMLTTLDDVWKNACVTSAVPMELIVDPRRHLMDNLLENSAAHKKSWGAIIEEKPPGTITEKEVLNKVIHADKINAKNPAKEISRRYASIAMAVIHPPEYFNLPSIVIHAEKIEKQSTFGAEDSLAILLWLETATGSTFVPMAIVGDNPKAQAIWKASLTGTPAKQYVQLVRKDELQIRVHGNTLFAGWTVPIPLYPPPYILPPACLLIEGYGNVKTRKFTTVSPSGFKSEIEGNYLDAFVTFMHPASKYSGPGTDGIFARDFIATDFPPKIEQQQPK